VSFFDDGLTKFVVKPQYIQELIFEHRGGQDLVVHNVGIRRGDRVTCKSGDHIGEAGTVTDVTPMGTCTVKFDKDKAEVDMIVTDLELLGKRSPTYGLGQHVKVKGKEAVVVYGPDNRGGYMVAFTEAGSKTGGPYTFIDFMEASANTADLIAKALQSDGVDSNLHVGPGQVLQATETSGIFGLVTASILFAWGLVVVRARPDRGDGTARSVGRVGVSMEIA